MAADTWIAHEVYVADALHPPDHDDWTLYDRLECSSLTRGLAPTISQATLHWQFGSIALPGEAMAYVDRLNIAGKYVWIYIPSLAGTGYEDWFGYVVREEMDRWPEETDAGQQRISGGDQVLEAVGLEWFLSRETVHTSWVYSDAEMAAYEINRAIGFNMGFGEGRGVTYEDRANMHVDADGFAEDPSDAYLWNARFAVDYMLYRHGPKDDGGSAAPCPFALANAATPFLNIYEPSVPTEGRSVWQILNDLISHSRGLVWWISYDFDRFVTEFTAVINVSSMAPAPLLLPGGATLPAALIDVALPDLNDPNERPRISRDLSRKYDHVICRGARRRAVFTVGVPAENLEPAWKTELETAYKAGSPTDDTDEKLNDEFRKANRFERVYQAFRIPKDWDGTSGDGSAPPAADQWCCPQLPQGSVSIVGAEKLSMPGLRLMRTMPIKVGYDYTDATNVTGEDPDSTAPEWLQPFAFIDVSEDETPSYRFTHDLGEDASGETLKSFRMQCLSAEAGVQFSAPQGLPHTLALNHFDPETDAVSDTEPQVDYEQLRVTVAGEWDAYCEGRYPSADATASPMSTLYINIGERARLDWMAANTVWDIQDGALKKTTTGGPLRDDRNLCVQLAQLAYEWYGQSRAQVSMQTNRVEAPPNIGTLITTIGTGAAQETVNAVVSQVTFNLAAGTTNWSAGFEELDFTSLV
jgi:hypothetical protein